MTAESEAAGLPKPFFHDGFPRSKRPAVQALWDFHTALLHPSAPALDGSDLKAYFQSEREKALRSEPLKVVPSGIADAAFLACTEFGLSSELLAHQIDASQRFTGKIRFVGNPAVNAFIDKFAGSHGRLLAHMADVSGSWQLVYVDELARAFFWVGRLMTLKRDVERDWVFIPKADLEQNEVTVEQLQAGRIDEKVRRLLWKQTIRAKDAFAQSEQLVLELPGRYASAFKRWWLGGLEVLNEIVRRDYDVWSEPVRLSRYQRAQARFQARFGRTTFRSQ